MEEILLLRKKIDAIDEQILQSLRKRLDASKEIGTMKKKLRIPISDPKREDEVFRHVMQKASELGLDTSRIKWIYREIIAICTNAQESIQSSQG